MKNWEKYKDEIMNMYIDTGSRFAVVKGEVKTCSEITCKDCDFLCFPECAKKSKEWLNEECKEVKIQEECKYLKKDDKILVSDDGKKWFRRHFMKYEDGFVFTYSIGATSWSCDLGETDLESFTWWSYAKMPEKEDVYSDKC